MAKGIAEVVASIAESETVTGMTYSAREAITDGIVTSTAQGLESPWCVFTTNFFDDIRCLGRNLSSSEALLKCALAYAMADPRAFAMFVTHGAAFARYHVDIGDQLDWGTVAEVNLN